MYEAVARNDAGAEDSTVQDILALVGDSKERMAMKHSMKQTMFWAPRILTALFTLFISLFAFDVFEEGYSFWETVLALLMHLIPTGIILLALLIAWRWEWVGAVLFIGLGLLYLVGFPGQYWSAYVVISGSLFVLGALFLVNWWYRAELRPRPSM